MTTRLYVLDALAVVADDDGWALASEIAEELGMSSVAVGATLGHARRARLVECFIPDDRTTLWGLTDQGFEFVGGLPVARPHVA